MNLLTTVNFHRFADGVLAEVVEESRDGEVSIRSHEFDVVDGDHGILRPRSQLSSTDAMLIDECATADGYSLEIEQIADPADGR